MKRIATVMKAREEKKTELTYISGTHSSNITQRIQEHGKFFNMLIYQGVTKLNPNYYGLFSKYRSAIVEAADKSLDLGNRGEHQAAYQGNYEFSSDSLLWDKWVKEQDDDIQNLDNIKASLPTNLKKK